MSAKQNKTKLAAQQPFYTVLLKKLAALPAYTAVFVTSVINRVVTWFKTRPEAIKNWKQADKKKKKYRSFRLQKKIQPEPRYIPSSFSLIKESLKFFATHKKVLLTILFIHVFVYVAVLRTPITTDMNAVKDSIQILVGDSQNLTGTVATLGAVISVSGGNQTNAVLTAVSTLIISLIYIWAIRQLHAGKTIKARDAYYQGSAPLFSTLLVLAVASVQLLPFIAASYIYTTARTNALFVSGFEDLSFFVVTALVGLLSFFWVTTSVIAIYIVTLPGVYPINAIITAKKLVQYQRFKIFKRIITLPIFLTVFYLFVLLLIIRFASDQVFIVIEVLQLLIIPLTHIYLYKLYRSLI